MRPFAFRLATILALWQQREDAALKELHRKQVAHRAALARVADLRDARAHASRDMYARTPRSSEPHDPSWHRNWIKHLSLAIDDALADAGRRAADERAAQLAWQRARRDRRVLDRLRDRAHRRHQVEMRREEMKLFDELAGLRPRKERTW